MKHLIACLVTLILFASVITPGVSAQDLISDVTLDPDSPLTLLPGEKTPTVTWSAPAGAHYRVDNDAHKVTWFNRTDWEEMAAYDVFEEGKTYQAELFLWVDEGYAFEDPANMTAHTSGIPYPYRVEIFKCWSRAERSVNLIFTVPYETEPEPDQVIPEASLGFDPAWRAEIGGNPNYGVKVKPGSHYEVKSVDWFESEGYTSVKERDILKENVRYSLRVDLIPDKGFAFAEGNVPLEVFGIDKAQVQGYIQAHTGRQLTVQIDFKKLSAGTPEPTDPADPIKGDVDGDNTITSTDARLTLQLSVNKIKSADLAVPAAADVDGDGKVTSTDARLILQKSVGKISDWP